LSAINEVIYFFSYLGRYQKYAVTVINASCDKHHRSQRGKLSSVMQSIMIIVYRTGSSIRHDAFELVQFWWKFLALSKRCGVTWNLLTNGYVCSRGVALSTTCSEIYLVQFCTPRHNLQHTCVLQVHCEEHSDREFSSWQDTNLQYTYW